MRLARCLTLVVVVGCAPSHSTDFLKARAAAQRSYVHGRYDEAAANWASAARLAGTARERSEARYRRAVSLRRAGRTEEAVAALDEIAEKTPRSPRAARARYDLADLLVERGRIAEGQRQLERVIDLHPDSGSALSALRRLVILETEAGGVSAARTLLDRLLRRHDRSALAEHLHYAYARQLEAQGLPEAALARYLYCAKRFPYPAGDLWDDSLMRASQIEEQLGRYRPAIAHLSRMLSEREPSHLQGSYERPRFSEAQFRVAVLYRDRVGDRERARREFRKVWKNHETSLLRDDARWEEARLALEAGHRRHACSAVKALVEEMPDSRYAPCARRLCPDAPRARGRVCRAYIARELDVK